MYTIILIIIVFTTYSIFFRKRVFIQKGKDTFTVFLSSHFSESITGPINLIIKRGIFTVRINSYSNIDEIKQGIKPYKIKKYDGINGILYGTNFTVRNFLLNNQNKEEILKSYNKNNEYSKSIYKNNLRIETKHGTDKGIVITRLEYDSNKRLIREFDIFNGENIERGMYEYDDKNKIIICKKFLKGELNEISEIELKKSIGLIDDNDRKYSFSNNWVKKTDTYQNRKVRNISYYNGKIEKRETYINEKLILTKIYDSDTGEIIKEEE